MLLQLKDICKDFGDGPILRDVSLELERGQSIAVVAPSGAGKSTLLSIVGLLMAPDSGSLLIDGQDVLALNDDVVSQVRAEKIGFLFQHTQLVGSLRAIENVTTQLSFVKSPDRKLGVQQADQRAEELLQQLGIEDRMHYFPSQMSVGQKRRVATARALFLEPEFIIADEPTNDLDQANADIVVAALFSRVESGEAGLIYATHDMQLAQRADAICRLA